MPERKYCPFVAMIPLDRINQDGLSFGCWQHLCALWNEQHKGCSYRVGTDADLAQANYLKQIAGYLEQLAFASEQK